MANMERAEELVGAIDGDAAFRAEVEAAPTMTAKRAVLDSRGYGDVGLDDMRAFVESKGGTLTLHEGGRELSEQELAAVAGGDAAADAELGLTVGIITVAGGIGAAAVAA